MFALACDGYADRPPHPPSQIDTATLARNNATHPRRRPQASKVAHRARRAPSAPARGQASPRPPRPTNQAQRRGRYRRPPAGPNPATTATIDRAIGRPHTALPRSLSHATVARMNRPRQENEPAHHRREHRAHALKPLLERRRPEPGGDQQADPARAQHSKARAVGTDGVARGSPPDGGRPIEVRWRSRIAPSRACWHPCRPGGDRSSTAQSCKQMLPLASDRCDRPRPSTHQALAVWPSPRQASGNTCSDISPASGPSL
jgi:hypothetical protein